MCRWTTRFSRCLRPHLRHRPSLTLRSPTHRRTSVAYCRLALPVLILNPSAVEGEGSYALRCQLHRSFASLRMTARIYLLRTFAFEETMFNRVRIFWIAFTMIALALTASAQDVTLDSDTLSGLPIRAIGPAAMGGRIADIAA